MLTKSLTPRKKLLDGFVHFCGVAVLAARNAVLGLVSSGVINSVDPISQDDGLGDPRNVSVTNSTGFGFVGRVWSARLDPTIGAASHDQIFKFHGEQGEYDFTPFGSLDVSITDGVDADVSWGVELPVFDIWSTSSHFRKIDSDSANNHKVV